MRRMLLSLAAVCAVFASAPAATAAYPDRPITVIVGFAAGGATDIMGRAFSDLLSKELGATFVVKNVTGAGGTIGAAELAKAKPDGYTLGYLPVGTMAIQPNLRKLPYQWNEFTPVNMVSVNPVVMAGSKKGPWKNFTEAVADIRANPDKYVYASSAPGGSPHFCMQALFSSLGLKVVHMPANGSAGAIQALQSGTAQFYADPPVIIRQFDLLGMGVFADKRMPEYPDMPTFRELGADVPNFTGWHAFWGPKGLAPDVVAALSAAAQRVVASEAFKTICERTDMTPTYMDAAATGAFFETEYQVYHDLAPKLGMVRK